MKNIFLLISIFLVPIASASAESTKLKLGFIGSFSGEAQIYGDAAKNGFELALDELGRDWIEVLYEDDAFLPKKTVAAFQKLTSADKVDAVISVGSTPSNAIAPMAESRQVPLIAWASDRKVSRGKAHVIRSYPSGYAEGAAAAKEAAKRGYKKFSIFISFNDYAQSWKNGFLGTVPESSVVLDQDIGSETKDFKPYLLRAKSKDSGQYVVCLDPGNSGVFAKQAAELQITAPIFGCEYLHDPDEAKSAHGALDEAWFPTVSVSDGFRVKYRKKYGNENIISGAANHYDLAYVLHQAFKSSSNNLIEGMLNAGTITGAVGEFQIRNEEGDRFFDIPLVIKEVSALKKNV